jgi:hypothetical protein
MGMIQSADGAVLQPTLVFSYDPKKVTEGSHGDDPGSASER